MSAPPAGGGERSPPGPGGGPGRAGPAVRSCRPCGAAAARVRGNAFDPFPRTFQERGAAAAGAANGRRQWAPPPPPARQWAPVRPPPPANGRRRPRPPHARGSGGPARPRKGGPAPPLLRSVGLSASPSSSAVAFWLFIRTSFTAFLYVCVVIICNFLSLVLTPFSSVSLLSGPQEWLGAGRRGDEAPGDRGLPRQAARQRG